MAHETADSAEQKNKGAPDHSAPTTARAKTSEQQGAKAALTFSDDPGVTEEGPKETEKHPNTQRDTQTVASGVKVCSQYKNLLLNSNPEPTSDSPIYNSLTKGVRKNAITQTPQVWQASPPDAPPLQLQWRNLTRTANEPQTPSTMTEETEIDCQWTPATPLLEVRKILL